jgi:hypothetical protein
MVGEWEAASESDVVDAVGDVGVFVDGTVNFVVGSCVVVVVVVGVDDAVVGVVVVVVTCVVVGVVVVVVVGVVVVLDVAIVVVVVVVVVGQSGGETFGLAVGVVPIFALHVSITFPGDPENDMICLMNIA